MTTQRFLSGLANLFHCRSNRHHNFRRRIVCKTTLSSTYPQQEEKEHMKMSRGSGVAETKGGKKKGATFVIDCSKMVEYKIMEISSLEKFLTKRIKVGGKVEAFDDSVTAAREKNKISVTGDLAFSKRSKGSILGVFHTGIIERGLCTRVLSTDLLVNKSTEADDFRFRLV